LTRAFAYPQLLSLSTNHEVPRNVESPFGYGKSEWRKALMLAMAGTSRHTTIRLLEYGETLIEFSSD
jgi:hypothetical protein